MNVLKQNPCLSLYLPWQMARNCSLPEFYQSLTFAQKLISAVQPFSKEGTGRHCMVLQGPYVLIAACCSY